MIDPGRKEDAQQRVKELRAEAEYYKRRVDSFNAQADVIERTWGLVEEPEKVLPANPVEVEGPPAFESFKDEGPIRMAAPWEEPNIAAYPPP